MKRHRDHGGGLDAAIARFGGERDNWIDLSTGINPDPFPIPDIPAQAWTALPDACAQDALLQAARAFWNVPREAAILAAPGASALIARLPALWPAAQVAIHTPTYNEHAAAFEAHGWDVAQRPSASTAAQVVVHPNNPDGRMWSGDELTGDVVIIDESFCDVTPDQSHMSRTTRGDTIILKSFGKFWGLAGMRLGFAIGAPAHIARLADLMGPWAVSGPALGIATAALSDAGWAAQARRKLAESATRLDGLMSQKGAKLIGGTDLFRLYDVDDARAWQDRLARGHVWSRIFPYSDTWLRLGLPSEQGWDQLGAAL
ncbi:threonine-phosphate decarboxylase [Celeribacter arenosi]|uniref:Aminotransferase n=1 Tax=Celeribacter arenosi TaxID=792649 RepID=A0ABP7K0W7_9RHOB